MLSKNTKLTLSRTSRKDILPNKLSKAFWEPIDIEKDSCIEWSISANSNTYQSGAARCDEKLTILLADPTSILNKRTKLTGKCRYKNKFKLKNFLRFRSASSPIFFITHDSFTFFYTASLVGDKRSTCVCTVVPYYYEIAV